METTNGSAPTPDEAAAMLHEAESSRDRLSGDLVLPRGFHVALGVAIAVQILTAAIGIAEQSAAGAGLAVVGAVVFLAIAADQLLRFRRLNGAWLGGLASRVVLGSGALASTVYGLAFAVAVWSAFEEAWWLTVLAAAVGGVGYGASGIRWMRAYRDDPVRYGRGESALMLVLLAVPLVVGAVLLLVER
jgi:hypothetical protein